MFLCLLCKLTHTHARAPDTQTDYVKYVKSFMFLYLKERERARTPIWNERTCAQRHFVYMCVCVCLQHTNKRPSKRCSYRIEIRCLWSGPMQIHTLHIFCVVCYLPLSIAAWKSVCVWVWVCVCMYAAKSMNNILLNIMYTLSLSFVLLIIMATGLLACLHFGDSI